MSKSAAQENKARLRGMQDRLLARSMQLYAVAHPHYRRVLAELGLAPDDFNTVEDLRALPVLHRSEYSASPELFRLELAGHDDVSPEEASLADVIYTTGSTGRPTPFYDTVHDRFSRILLLKRMCEIAGIGFRDTVMNLFPLSAVPHQGFASAMWGAMATGSKLLSGMTGRDYGGFAVHNRMDHAINVIEREGATVLWGITSYVRHVIVRAQELGKDLSSVRLAMVMGEPCPKDAREDIRRRLRDLGSRAPVVNNGYGFTEMQGPAAECGEFQGTHQAAPELFYFEVIEPGTGAPLPDGEPGMLLISHLNRRGTVLLRYAVGDVVAMTHETCPHCGRWEPRFLGTPYRMDGITKVKGTLVNPAVLTDQLALVLGRGVAEYQIVVTREDPDDRLSPDAMIVRLACAADSRGKMRQMVEDRVRSSFEITPRVEFLPPDGFAEMLAGYKFRRFVDER